MSDIPTKAAALRNLGEVIYKRNLSNYNRIRENQGLTFLKQDQLQEAVARRVFMYAIRFGFEALGSGVADCTLVHFGELWPTFLKVRGPST
jgi:hypothetical protein